MKFNVKRRNTEEKAAIAPKKRIIPIESVNVPLFSSSPRKVKVTRLIPVYIPQTFKINIIGNLTSCLKYLAACGEISLISS